MMQQAQVHKNASIAVIIYFIQNLQLSNSVVGALMVVVVDIMQLQLHCLAGVEYY